MITVKGNYSVEDKLLCANCQKEYEDSDAEDFEKFCCSTCEAEYMCDLDDDSREELAFAKEEDTMLELALEEHREKKGRL